MADGQLIGQATRCEPCETSEERNMTRDLGVWTYENSALVLIDYQKEMFEMKAAWAAEHA